MYRRNRRPLLALALTGSIFCGSLWLLPHDSGSGSILATSRCRPDMEVNLLPPMSADDDTMLKDLFTYLTRPNSRTCGRVASLGGKVILRKLDYIPVLDGNKFICLDPEFSLHSANHCLVYSVGISDDWSFDWDAEAFGCSVYAFDPSIRVSNDTAGGGSINFTPVGLDAEDRWLAVRRWQLHTLETLVQQRRHQQRIIHYLKVDVEGSEWAVLQQQVELGAGSVLASNVQQLGVELHLFGHLPLQQHLPFYRQMYNTFRRMQGIGFYLFAYEPNPTDELKVVVPGLDENVATAMEVVWLKSACVGPGDKSRARV